MTTAASPAADLRGDGIEARILDAALVRFEKVGVKKTTIEDVARQAGVDRVTVYRRIGSRDDLVRAVFEREVAVLLAELADLAAQHDNAGDLITSIFVTVLTRWRASPLATKLLALEPERVLPQLTTEGGPVFTMSISATAAAMEQAAGRGLLPARTDYPVRAELVCRIVHSMVLVPQGPAQLETEEQLREFARQYLVPIITS